MADHFRNKPFQNRSVGIVTSLFIACAGVFCILGIEIVDAYTSLTGWTMEVKEQLPLWYVFGIGTIVFYLLRRKVVRDIYNEIERNLDD